MSGRAIPRALVVGGFTREAANVDADFRYAHLLGKLHRQLHDCPDARVEIDARRRVMIEAVDRWVGMRRSCPLAAVDLGSETVGTVVDQMARAQVLAYHLLMTLGDAEPQVHDAWYRLAMLVDQYHDITATIQHRQRRFPPLAPTTHDLMRSS